jgi:hypothetical protein
MYENRNVPLPVRIILKLNIVYIMTSGQFFTEIKTLYGLLSYLYGTSNIMLAQSLNIPTRFPNLSPCFANLG